KQRLQHRSLARRDSAIIDELGRTRCPVSGPKPLPPHQLAHALVLGKAGYCRYVDVEIVELAAAGRRVGADMPRLCGEQGVQRIYADHRGIAGSRSASQHCEIGKIAHSPIPLAAQAIELTAQPPATRTRP